MPSTSRRNRGGRPPASAEARDADLFELVEARAPRAAERIEGIVIGTLVEVDANGAVRVDFRGNPGAGPLRCRSAARVTPDDAGREVALLFESGDPQRPLLMGLIQEVAADATPGLRVQADGERVVLEAEREIVLRCGQASVTLTREGKVRIRGTDLLSRSSGGNRIKGGSVQIN